MGIGCDLVALTTDHRLHQTGRARPVIIPWGPHESLTLEFPAEWPAAEVVWPDLGGVLSNYPDALSAALERPIGLDRLDRLVRPGTTVAIIVDDPSRWTPVRDALPILLRFIHAAGVRREDVTISVGVGRHRPVDATAMRTRVGDEVAKMYPCHSPPVDDPAHYVYLGRTAQGVPVRVFRPVAAADLRILVGSVLPHLQAGFGGGYKLIFPGCSHRSTLVALHGQGLEGDAGGLLGGDLATNPMRIAIRAAAALLPGPCLSISHLLGDQGQVLRVVAGHPDTVQDALSSEARSRFQAPAAPPADLVVAGNAPWPGDPMMSFKVLLQHRAAGKAGGVLAGFFWTNPAEIDRSVPMAATRAVAATGAVGGYVARRGLKLADRIAAAVSSPASFMIRWARELVVDRTILIYAPPLRERFGTRLGPVYLFADQASLWREAAGAARADRTELMRVRVFPHGGLTYACSAQSTL